MSGAHHLYSAAHPPPPPPPISSSSPLNVYQPAVPRSPLRRIHAQQPPLIHTAVGAQHRTFLHPSTPASAFPTNTPLSPYSNNSSASTNASNSSRTFHSPSNLQSPASSMAYNPQEWGRHGPTGGGAFMAHTASPQHANIRPEHLTGMEAALPSPPPPYSPPPHQSMSHAMHASPQASNSPFAPHHPAHPQQEYASSTASSSRTAQSASTGYSAEPTRTMSAANTPQMGNMTFAPPPGQGRDRSASRSRNLFGGLSFTRNRGQEAAASPNAMSASRSNTMDVHSRTPESAVRRAPTTNFEQTPIYAPDAIRPPAARRAASTGAIGLAGPSRRPPGPEAPASSQWTPGTAVPPPPPGPPPSGPGSRSQSMTRAPEYGQASSSSHVPPPPPPTRRPAQMGTALGPVPPTPADWVDEDAAAVRPRSPAGRGLRLETNPTVSGAQWHAGNGVRADLSSSSAGRTAGEPQTAHPTTGLSRTGARREPSVRGIRERRSESRAARERSVEPQTAIEMSNNPWARDMEAAKPADLVLNAPTGAISRRREINKSTPRSAGRSMVSPADPPQSATGRRMASYEQEQISSAHSTPRTADHSQQVMSPESHVPTPPFSPNALGKAPVGREPTYVPSKALPTPPSHSANGDMSSSLGLPPWSAKDRPVSHILHVPNDDVSMHAPLSPARPPSAGNAAHTPKPSQADLFAKSSIDRHRLFVEKEMAAESDIERLELFADFIVTESRLRRDRYSAAFDSLAGDIFELTRDMWRSYNATGRRSATPNQSNATSLTSKTDRTIETHITAPSPTPSRSGLSSAQSAPESPSSAGSQLNSRGEPHHFSGFKPCLSPIPSMAMSTVPDEEASRGRSASRWWEGSAENASAGRGGNKIERTKRESKYMGVPREAREYLQYDGENTPSYAVTPAPVDYSQLGPNEYPPEKTGGYEQQPPSSAHSNFFFPQSAPATPDPYKLDVSRLVTLPPPYPRHHPAVNNNHPDLASIRNIYRAIGDFDTIAPLKADFTSKMEAARVQEKTATTERRNHLRFEIQEQIRSGHMSFADAAKAEADFEAAEVPRAQAAAKQEFEAFKAEVHGPLHALFSERITKATASIDHLVSGLKELAEDPNRIQEEGDEQPELLEKLTLLKWLFELREQLHREIFDLESQRDEHYKTVILTPYLLSSNVEKIADVQAFFQKDFQERMVSQNKSSLSRFEAFLAIVEQYVTSGVEDQLSAFWDIAPSLSSLINTIPSDLEELQILIPPTEYDENPAYWEFPAQYLYSLLSHARKSAYQFIEAQVNLLCLLHEVRTGVMHASTRLLESQRVGEGEVEGEVEEEMAGVRADEERRLTWDLKEKVGVVEGQWEEGLGGGLEGVRGRVEGWLVERGGWDEGLVE